MRKILKPVLFGFIFISLFVKWNRILLPNTSIFDGRNENSYMNYEGFENLPHDSLDYAVLGSSNVFMNVNPIKVWENHGISGYAYASPAQSFYTTKYYLVELLKKQNPKVIFVDCWGITYGHTIESYTHLGLDYYSLSADKFEAIRQLPYELEEFYFPFTLYHSRWNNLYKSDFKGQQYDFNEDFLGYVPTYMIQECMIPLLSTDKIEGFEAQIAKDTENLLLEMQAICEENSVDLVLIKTPNAGWTIDMSDICEKFATEHGMAYIDFNGYKSPVEIDLTVDFCDGGHHLNIYGANKISDYLGGWIKEHYKIYDDKNDSSYSYYNKFVESLEHYGLVSELKQQTDFNTWMSLADDENLYILLAGENNESTAMIVEQLKNQYGCGINDRVYTAIINQGVIDEMSSGDMLCMERTVAGNQIYLEANQSDDKRRTKIQLNYQNYSKNGLFNVVVYDKRYNKVIDNFSIQNDELLTIVR